MVFGREVHGEMVFGKVGLGNTVIGWVVFGKMGFGRAVCGKKGFGKKGIWENGTWENGVWKGGTWKDGYWKNGSWQGGEWFGGKGKPKDAKVIKDMGVESYELHSVVKERPMNHLSRAIAQLDEVPSDRITEQQLKNALKGLKPRDYLKFAKRILQIDPVIGQVVYLHAINADSNSPDVYKWVGYTLDEIEELNQKGIDTPEAARDWWNMRYGAAQED